MSSGIPRMVLTTASVANLIKRFEETHRRPRIKPPKKDRMSATKAR